MCSQQNKSGLHAHYARDRSQPALPHKHCTSNTVRSLQLAGVQSLAAAYAAHRRLHNHQQIEPGRCTMRHSTPTMDLHARASTNPLQMMCHHCLCCCCRTHTRQLPCCSPTPRACEHGHALLHYYPAVGGSCRCKNAPAEAPRCCLMDHNAHASCHAHLTRRCSAPATHSTRAAPNCAHTPCLQESAARLQETQVLLQESALLAGKRPSCRKAGA